MMRKTTIHRFRPARAAAIEWIGGIVSMPAHVTGEGDPYRPEMLIWMGAEGAVLGYAVARPGELLPLAGESLQRAIEEPIYGPPHAPARIRVASAELAEVLRAGHPAIDVVRAPTPELDEVLGLMTNGLNEDAAAERSYLSPEVGPEAVAAFFRAAAGLFRAKPWQVVPSDQDLFSVTVERFDLRDAVISVIGQMGQSRGLLLFAGLDDFEAFLNAGDTLDAGETPDIPPHFAMNFERGADLPSTMRKEIAKHRWEVAHADAYPWLVAIDEDLVGRPPTADEVTMAEAIALALTQMLTAEKDLHTAWLGGEPVTRTLAVDTCRGTIEVTLGAGCLRAPAGFDPSRDLIAELAALAGEADRIDPAAREAIEHELLDRFAASPEARELEEIGACCFVTDLAASHLGATIATLDSSGLHEIIYEIIPRKVSIDASAARWIIEVLRAFYGFLKRKFGLVQADACLLVLGGDAAERLEAALSDPGNFGMAKSLVMAGRDAGFDTSTREGLEAWMRTVQGAPLPPAVHRPSPTAPQQGSRKAAKAKKKRKAARKARKRQR